MLIIKNADFLIIIIYQYTLNKTSTSTKIIRIKLYLILIYLFTTVYQTLRPQLYVSYLSLNFLIFQFFIITGGNISLDDLKMANI